MAVAHVVYFSDILCIWAYITEIRVNRLVQEFADVIEIEPRFCSVFPDAHGKIKKNWGESDGFTGFNTHLREVAADFPHIEVSDQIWLKSQPRSSASAHMFIKAIKCIEDDKNAAGADELPYPDRMSVRATMALRHAFFGHARDISDWQVHQEIAEELGIDYDQVREKIISSEAVAALASDMNMAQQMGVVSSPTLIMNNGRQKLIGNVGYRVLEANVHELLRNPNKGEASWC